MLKLGLIAKRELYMYFSTPIAYVFLIIFLLLNGLSTFYFGNFFARGQADLQSFFSFHPWIYMIFIPAISMRLWAEERKSGTIELLFTLPITTLEIVLGKFLAAWLFSLIALLLTFPIWLVVNYLGSPDNGVILASYIGSWLMAGAFLAIGAAVSASTKNQVIAFVLTNLLCLVANLCGFPMIMDSMRAWLPQLVIDTITGFSFLTNFEVISKGILDMRVLFFFLSLIVLALFANVVIIEQRKAD